MIFLEAQPRMRAHRDPLSEVLDVFPLPVGYTGSFCLTAPWGVSIPKRSAFLCAVSSGQCWLTGDGLENPKRVSPGDFLVLSPTCEHQLRDSLDDPVVSIHELVDCSGSKHRSKTRHGGGGTQTRWIGSVLEFNGCGIHPLCSALPPILHLTLTDTELASDIGGILAAIERELLVRRPGGEAIVRRLAEVLMAQMARLYLAAGGEIEAGAMKGMIHRDLGPALTHMHRQPDQPWTVASLAEHANMSRSSFSATFTEVLEIPPLQYLRKHRMRTASRLLCDSSLGLKEISSRVGYDSVSAFSMAFKKFSGLAPGDFRRRELQAR